MKSVLALVFFGCSSIGTLVAQRPHPLSKIPHRDRTQLEEQGVVITGREYFQIFEPYIFSELPVFITTDSILNAYHVLFEESVAAMEKSQAGRFVSLLDRMWHQLMQRGGSKLARLVLGVALELLGRSIEGATPEEIAAIKAEAQRVEAAQGFAKPTWLGPAEPDSFGFDYSRFKPVGFYTRTEKMQRYFRTLSWLQAVPFRLANDEELTAITHLAAALDGGDWKQDERDLEVLHRYAEFIGSSDDWDIKFAANRLDLRDTPAENREGVRAELRHEVLLPKINDQIRFAPQDPRTVAEPNFRIVSAWRLPDAVLMQKTALQEPGEPARWPSGLDVAVALGSNLAAKTLGKQSPNALATVQQNLALFRPGASLYHDYLYCLSALFEAPHANAPDLFRSQAWQAKSLNTALAGWAQIRHTWALQAKEATHYAGIDTELPGFVEPNVEFFSRFSALVRSSAAAFEKDGAIAIAPENLHETIVEAIAVMEAIEEQEEPENPTGQETQESDRFWDRASESLLLIRPLIDAMEGVEFPWQNVPDDIPAVVAELKLLLPVAKSKAGAKMLASGMAHGELSLLSRWRTLETLSRRLQDLATKQLMGLPFNQSDNVFLRTYGKPLGSVMFYDGNSWKAARDTAPRATTVFSADGNYLHAAIGRPRAIYVLYPWKGKKVICRGAVMPYYEFQNATRLTDADWLTKIQSKKVPSLPKFTYKAFSSE